MAAGFLKWRAQHWCICKKWWGRSTPHPALPPNCMECMLSCQTCSSGRRKQAWYNLAVKSEMKMLRKDAGSCGHSFTFIQRYQFASTPWRGLMCMCDDLIGEASHLHRKHGSSCFDEVRGHVIWSACLAPTQLPNGLHHLPRWDEGTGIKLEISSRKARPTQSKQRGPSHREPGFSVCKLPKPNMLLLLKGLNSRTVWAPKHRQGTRPPCLAFRRPRRSRIQ